MNTAELTTLHHETIDAITLARTLTNITRRAESLIADGYKIEEFATGLYHVRGPQGQHYMVTCDKVVGFLCDCKAFAQYTTCKHLQGVDILQRDAAQADAYEAFLDEQNDEYALRSDCNAYGY